MNVQSNIVLVLILMLSFTTFHDTLLPLIDKHEHTYVANDQGDTSVTLQYNNCSETHSLMHYTAIMQDDASSQLEFEKNSIITHLSIEYSPPHKVTTKKPPIV